jgi:hypothetical protein
MRLGYARVSTGDQTLDGQRQRLSAAGCEKLFEEKISGARRNRPKFEKLIEQLRTGDILVVTRLERLARSTSELLRIAERLTEKSAGLQSLDEPWADTTSPSRSAPLPGPSTSTRRRSTASSRDRGLMLLFCSSQPHRPNSVLGRWKGRTDSVSGDANCHITPSLSTSSRTSCFTRRSRAMKLESVRSRG